MSQHKAGRRDHTAQLLEQRDADEDGMTELVPPDGQETGDDWIRIDDTAFVPLDR